MSKFELPALLYTYEALEPHFDTLTMTIHHSRHHQAYVDNLNKALEQDDIKNLELPDLIKHIQNYYVYIWIFLKQIFLHHLTTIMLENLSLILNLVND